MTSKKTPTPREDLNLNTTLTLVLSDGSHRNTSWSRAVCIDEVFRVVSEASALAKAHKRRIVAAVLCLGLSVTHYGEKEVAGMVGEVA